MILTIDGPAGSGKSTVAEALSKKLNFLHFNSGSLYRAITAHIIENNIPLEQIGKLKVKLNVEFKNDVQHVFVNGIDYTAKLRDNEVSVLTPTVSTYPNIRKIIDDCQRKFIAKHNVVVDGRDIGSFVFPNAEIKFYLDCSLDERARRRYNEEKLKNSAITLDEIKKQISARDEIDKNKKIAPLVIPTGAKIIDSTTKTIDEVVNDMLNYVNKK